MEEKRQKIKKIIEKKIFWIFVCFGILDFLSSFSSYKMESKKKDKVTNFIEQICLNLCVCVCVFVLLLFP